MDWNKYKQIPEEFATASEIGIAAATLGAMARRGFVEVLDTVPKQYKRIGGKVVEIYQAYEKNKKDLFVDTFFILYKENQELGMICSMINGTVVDCWGKAYKLNDVNKIVFKSKEVII